MQNSSGPIITIYLFEKWFTVTRFPGAHYYEMTIRSLVTDHFILTEKNDQTMAPTQLLFADVTFCSYARDTFLIIIYVYFYTTPRTIVYVCYHYRFHDSLIILLLREYSEYIEYSKSRSLICTTTTNTIDIVR